MKNVIKKCLLKQIPILIIVFLCIAFYEYLYTLPPKVLGSVIDLLVDKVENKEAIFILLRNLILISFAILFVRLIWKYLISISTRKLEKQMKDSMFEEFLLLPLEDIQNIKNGEIMSYLTKDIAEIRGLAYRVESHLSRIILTLIIVFITMKNINTTLSLIVLITILIAIIVSLILKKNVEKSFKKAQASFTDVSEFVQESTDAIRTTKAYSGEEQQYDTFINKNENLKNNNIKVDYSTTFLSSFVDLAFGICYALLIFVGARLVIKGDITIGDLVAFNGYVTLLFIPVYWLPGILSKLQRAQISLNRLDKIFKLEKEPIKIENSNVFDNKVDGKIEIADLTYSYPQTSEPVLKNINISLEKGKTLGIIGTIGSGKTTLLNLLMKLYKVENGKIFIDGKDINNIDLNELRSSICYITQDHFLFSTSISKNVTMFKEGYEKEKIIDSVRQAIFEEDLANMKDGVETIIGERGIDLSGGQKQRVVLSRAFLKDKNFIFLDDCFSALDNKTEEKLLKNINKMKKDKTCIIISNRISDVKDADEIIVLDRGNMVEQGTHEELLKNNGLYSKFYKQQSSTVD